MRSLNNDQRGVLITVVVIAILTLTLLAGYVMTLAYNQKKIVDQVSGNRVQRYYAAQAGVVDAQWRIRNNSTTELGGGAFTNPVFSPTYYLNLATDSVHSNCVSGDNVKVVIGAFGAEVPDLRKIQSSGIESC